jgi:hypothetical protein
MEVSLSRERAETLALSVVDRVLEPKVVFSGLFEAGTLREDLAAEGAWAHIGDPLWDAGRFGIAGDKHAPVWVVAVDYDAEASVCIRAGIKANAPPEPGERWLKAVYIDGTDGQTAGLRFTMDSRILQALHALPTAIATVRATAVPIATVDRSDTVPPTWTVAPVEIPEVVGTSSDSSSAFASVGETLKAFPLRVGSRWTYRIRMRDDQVWASAVATHTVRSLVPARDGNGLIASMYEARRLTEIPLVDLWGMPASLGDPRGVWRIRITPSGLFELDNPDKGSPFQILSVEAVNDSAQSEVFPISEQWRVLWPEDVVVPAGTFRDCQLMQWRPGNTGGHHRWFCPGIGFVRQELCTSTNPSISVIWELLEYQP